MKFLIFSDVHGNENEKLYDYLESNDIDLVIITGDITNFGPLDFVDSFINKIASYDVDIMAIPGNCDIDGVTQAITSSGAVCLHNQVIPYGDALLIGFGGSNETPFDTPGEMSDDELYDNLSNLLKENNINDDSKVKILVTHAPPLETNADLIDSGAHVGSEAVLKIINEFQPDLNLCGHIHEARSKDIIGDCEIFNPGMLENDGAILIEITDGVNYTAQLISL